jgi:hypothetical protein
MWSVVKLRSQIFKSGQIAQVMAANSDGLRRRQGWPFATWLRHLCAIEQGKPRASSIVPVPVPRGGLSAPRNAANESSSKPPRSGGADVVKPGAVRISSPMGKVRLNVHRPRTALPTNRRKRMAAAATQLTKAPSGNPIQPRPPIRPEMETAGVMERARQVPGPR